MRTKKLDIHTLSNWILLGGLLFIAAIVLRMAYQSSRPSPVMDIFLKDSAAVEVCFKTCLNCFHFNFREDPKAFESFRERCTEHAFNLIVKLLNTTYSNQALEYAHMRMGGASSSIYSPAGERYMYEYDSFVKRYDRAPTSDELQSFWGLAFK